MKRSLFGSAIACALLNVPAVAALNAQASASASATAQSSGSVKLLGYDARVPAGWSPKQAASSMRLAEFAAPAGAEVVVYFFGVSQGGTVEANLTRWKAQFSNPDGRPVEEKITHEKTGDIPLTIAEYRGTYARGVGAGSSADQAKPNQILTAIVAETPRGTLFFQLFGPAAAVEAQRNDYFQFVRSLK